MFNQKFNEIFNKLLNKKLTINLTAMFFLVSQITFAQAQIQVEKINRSVGGLKSNVAGSKISKHEPKKQLEVTQRTLAFKGMNRADVGYARQKKTAQFSPTLPTLSTLSTSQGVYNVTASHHSFSIYTGYSQLITDIDEDGYYQTFSVTFDADILSPTANEQAIVYADLYLSQDGGPWVLYFSTDDFVITGEETEDEFEVVTQLDSGYIPDNYDVLIDLYEVGFSDVVATFSSNDSNALYALPLESSDYDPEYIDVEYYDEHGGGSIWLLFGTLLTLVYRHLLVKLTSTQTIN